MEQTKFLKKLSKEQENYVIKRVTGVILATDMEKHLNFVKIINEKIEQQTKWDENFENQQLLLDLCVHSSDLSWLARDFKIGQVWAGLLFEEFFNQGDVQVQQNMPISMLCDRNPKNTNIPKGQVGFIAFGPLPLFK